MTIENKVYNSNYDYDNNKILDINFCNELILNFFEENNIKYDFEYMNNKITQSNFNAILLYINKNYISPSRILYNSISDYDQNILIQLYNYLQELCYRFNKVLNYMTFSLLSGIEYSDIIRWSDKKYSNLVQGKIFQNLRNSHIETLSDKLKLTERERHYKKIGNFSGATAKHSI